MRRFATVGAAVACSRSQVDGWTGGRVDRFQNAGGPVRESLTKKQATHYASRLVPGRMATTANRSFGPCSKRASRALQSDRRMLNPTGG
jgi:hypothetical protein